MKLGKFTLPSAALLMLFGLAILIMVLSSCGADGKYTEKYKDADRGEANTDPADTITFPDGYSNVSTKCDHGNRIYVLFHEDNPYGGVAVVPNAKGCQ